MNAVSRLAVVPVVAASLLLLTAAPVGLAQQPVAPTDDRPSAPGRAPTPSLTVTGQAKLDVPADELRLSFSVVSEGGENIPAGDVMDENSRKAEQVIAALREAGLGEKEIETGRFTITPRYTQPQRGQAMRIVGYRVENEVRVTTKKIELAGDLIQKAVEAGANQVSSINFGLADERAKRAEAIAQATRHARSDAEALADAAGVRLVRALRIDLDQPSFEPPRPYAMDMMMRSTAEAAPAPPIQPGDVEVHARVTIVYEIEAR